jgi:hypothetical protein
MKIFKTSLLLLSVFIVTTAFAPAKKHVYSTEEGKFSITFPGEYSSEREEKENATTIKTTCIYEGHTYFASYSLHQTEMTDHKDMAEVSYDAFIEAVKGQLLSKSDWDVKDNEGLKAVMIIADNTVKLEYRVVLVGNIQYQLVAMAAVEEYNSKAIDKFFKSFKLMK